MYLKRYEKDQIGLVVGGGCEVVGVGEVGGQGPSIEDNTQNISQQAFLQDV